MTEQYYSFQSLARRIDYSYSFIQKNWKTWCAEGRIEIKNLVFIGKTPRFPESEVEKLIESFKLKSEAVI